MFKKIAFVAALFLIVVGSAWAQAPGDTAPPFPDRIGTQQPEVTAPSGTNAYGTPNYTAAVTPPHAFHPFDQALGYVSWSGGYIGPQTGDTGRFFDAPVYIPSGARINSVKVMVYDSTATGYVRFFLMQESCTGDSPCTQTMLMDTQTVLAETPGYTWINSTSGDPVQGMTWMNYDQPGDSVLTRRFRVSFSEATSSLRLGPVWVWYQRQISPAPAVSSFPDVGTGYWAFQEIEALVSSGITTGYPDGTFKPTAAVTRAQMATFLARALGLDYPDYAY